MQTFKRKLEHTDAPPPQLMTLSSGNSAPVCFYDPRTMWSLVVQRVLWEVCCWLKWNKVSPQWEVGLGTARSLWVREELENQTWLLRPDCGGEDVGKLLESFKHFIDWVNLLTDTWVWCSCHRRSAFPGTCLEHVSRWEQTQGTLLDPAQSSADRKRKMGW